MDKKAWVHQLKKQIDQRGKAKAAWYVTWNDPEGRRRTTSCGPGKVGHRAAEKLADKIHAELVTGTYRSKSKTTWDELRSKYEEKIASRFDGPSRQAAEMALNNFQRVAKPKYLKSITADLIDGYVSKRLEEFAQRTGKPDRSANKILTKVSPATVNKELRYVRLVLNVAKEWKMIQEVPKIRFLKLPKLLPTFIPADHFAAVYTACGKSTMPGDVRNIAPAQWWRGLIVMGYMTGWRISQLLSLKWADVDLSNGTAIARVVEGNKGKREERIPLHPLVIDHLKPLAGSFDELVFPWTDNPRNLWLEFQRIQQAAQLADGSPMPKGGKRGDWYGFHDLRRGFATMNAGSMDLFELQGLMQHRTLETTREYVNMAKRYNETVKNLFVPQNLRISEVG